MIVNGKETPPTPPAQQQANRQQLAEDLRSGRYRQEKIFIHSNDGSRVCVLGAAYETARRVHANGLTIPPLAQAVANESIFQGSKVRGVIADAYGFSTWQRLKLVHKNANGVSFEQLAKVILEMPPAGSVAPPGPATRLRNRLTRLWGNARGVAGGALRPAYPAFRSAAVAAGTLLHPR